MPGSPWRHNIADGFVAKGNGLEMDRASSVRPLF